MESNEAFRSLLKIAKQNNFNKLEDHLNKSEPIKIRISSLSFTYYLISVVVSQQLSTKAADIIWQRVHKVIEEDHELVDFNMLLQIAGLSQSKTRYVLGLLENKKLLEFDRQALIGMPKEEFEKLLLSNYGIGPWSVQMARMFYLGDSDIFPVNDLGIKHAHDKLFPKHKLDKSFYEVFKPWRTYLSLFMWNSLS